MTGTRGRHVLDPKMLTDPLNPHEGECVGTLCPSCGCCMHCGDNCQCGVCTDDLCACAFKEPAK